jgi:hypothetical protein
MTGNVVQAIADEAEWGRTLEGIRDVLRPGGHLVFETRDPAFEAWREWHRRASYRVTDVDGVGAIETAPAPDCRTRCAVRRVCRTR